MQILFANTFADRAERNAFLKDRCFFQDEGMGLDTPETETRYAQDSYVWTGKLLERKNHEKKKLFL